MLHTVGLDRRNTDLFQSVLRLGLPRRLLRITLRKMAKKMFSCRLPPELIDWVDEHVLAQGFESRTEFIQALIEAVQEGRYDPRPRAGVNAFPAEEVGAGETPDFPHLISWGGISE